MAPASTEYGGRAAANLVIAAEHQQSGALLAGLLQQDGHGAAVVDLGSCTPAQVAQQRAELVLLWEGAVPALAMSCCAILRSDGLTADLPIVVVSNCFRRDSRARWAALGADDYLCALFDSAVLSARVAALVARHRRRLAALEHRRAALGLLSALAARSPALAAHLRRVGLVERPCAVGRAPDAV